MNGVSAAVLVVHEGKPAAVELAARLTSFLGERGVAIDGERAEIVISLGGDGTMLRAAQLAHSLDAPLLGVNLGLLGYLSEVDPDSARHALERVLAGDFEIEERMMLACEVSGGEDSHYVGLNEVLVDRSGRHRLVRLAVRIGGEELAAFNADGLIVATPTGSTAYALSAGGPIVSPRANCLILVPVSAHMIFSRPFVLAPDETVEITVGGSEQGASVSLDGALGRDLAPDTVVTVHRDDKALKLVRLGGPGFVERLRRKLDLPV
ncbi:MAG: NAD(+)/NADH kinase [Actinomycetota bacterium]|nr:NAD(+)/NADH kinase [Actinomycetota bacterium]